MDRNERETRDFMNVESFSQLPFIRPAPPPKEKGSATAIRLFGKEFGSTVTNIEDSDESQAGVGGGEAATSKELNSENTETSSRKFECHYCCRNFPTSQALGGHQNAHKRERQNAKRAHLQSVMVHAGAISEDYGVMSYSRLGSALPPPYHSWNGGGGGGSYSAATRSYGSHGSYNAHLPQPINGSPLGLWRIPAPQNPSTFPHERVSVPTHRQIPLLNSKNEQLMKPFSAISSAALGSQNRYHIESNQDHDGGIYSSNQGKNQYRAAEMNKVGIMHPTLMMLRHIWLKT